MPIRLLGAAQDSQQNNIAVRQIATALIESRALPDLDPILDEIDVSGQVPEPL